MCKSWFPKHHRPLFARVFSSVNTVQGAVRTNQHFGVFRGMKTYVNVMKGVAVGLTAYTGFIIVSNIIVFSASCIVGL